MNTIRAILKRIMTPTPDQLIGMANREMHQFHLGKYRNFAAANKHRQRAHELYAQARAMKES